MAQTDVIMPVQRGDALPVIRTIGTAELMRALGRGLDDFKAMPTHVVFLGLLYPVVGLILGAAAMGYDLLPLLYPLAGGFALVGPFAAIGLYELSRRREMGLDTSWRHAFDIVHSPSIVAIATLGGLLLLIFAVWIACARGIYVANFGYWPLSSPWEYLGRVFSTNEGMHLIVVGNLVGFLFAAVAATLSVISFPLLLDRNVGFGVAIATSVRAVARNPVTMALWGLIVAGLLALGSLPLFIGLAVVVPVLGHATWHLYREVIEPDPHARPEYRPRDSGPRYAAEFPAALFSRFLKRRDD